MAVLVMNVLFGEGNTSYLGTLLFQWTTLVLTESWPYRSRGATWVTCSMNHTARRHERVLCTAICGTDQQQTDGPSLAWPGWWQVSSQHASWTIDLWVLCSAEVVIRVGLSIRGVQIPHNIDPLSVSVDSARPHLQCLLLQGHYSRQLPEIGKIL